MDSSSRASFSYEGQASGSRGSRGNRGKSPAIEPPRHSVHGFSRENPSFEAPRHSVHGFPSEAPFFEPPRHSVHGFPSEHEYHQFLQQQSYYQDMNPNPQMTINEPQHASFGSQPFHSSFDSNTATFSQGHDEDEDQETEEIQPSAAKQKSDLFRVHMKKIEHPDGRITVKCNYCDKEYQWSKSGGYGTYRKHITSKHPDKEVNTQTQQQIGRYTTKSSALFRYSDEQTRRKFAEMIAIDGLSFSFGQKVGFKEFCRGALNPQMCDLPRTTATRHLYKLYKDEKKRLISYLETHNGRVTICADIWSDHWREHSYLGVTCHWVDQEWRLQKRILAFRCFDEQHSAHNIYSKLQSIFDEYKITNKIFAIGFDNASNNTAAIPALKELCLPYFGGKFFHQRCVCHVLNLCVQAGLVSLSSSIKPIRDAVVYLWKHPNAQKEFSRFCKRNNMPPKRFPRDVPTRWNSTYTLLSSTIYYKELLCSFFSNNSDIHLFTQHWDACTKICELLKEFNDATLALSGVYYPTTHLFLIYAVNIVGKLSEYRDDDILSDAIACIRSKFLDYYRNIPIIYLIAICFDPRCKLYGLSTFLQTYYECLELDDPDDPNYVNANAVHNEITSLFHSLCEEYLQAYGPSLNISTSSRSTSQSSQSSLRSRGFNLLARAGKSRRTSGSGTSSSSTALFEAEIYLNTEFVFLDNDDNNLDVLQWWKDHEKNFPILSIIAKQIFGTPASTVAVEQEFSAGGNMLDETRSRMTPQSIEIQVCTSDWGLAKIREQENDKSGIINDFFSDDATTTATEGEQTDS